ncbi:hypothetical protein D3C75_842030 [compost metagenome]
MRVSQKGLPRLQDVGLSPDSDLAGSGMNEMDFVQVPHAGADAVAGSTLFTSPIMKMQIGIAPERAL